jgi:hypothetical protein
MSSPSRAETATKAVASIASFIALPHPAGAANDNAADAQGDALLRTALRMFADYGLGAGHRAQAEAETAFFAGERDRYRWWLAVTRTLDRKLAVELAGRMGSDRFGSQSLPAR